MGHEIQTITPSEFVKLIPKNYKYSLHTAQATVTGNYVFYHIVIDNEEFITAADNDRMCRNFGTKNGDFIPLTTDNNIITALKFLQTSLKKQTTITIMGIKRNWQLIERLSNSFDCIDQQRYATIETNNIDYNCFYQAYPKKTRYSLRSGNKHELETKVIDIRNHKTDLQEITLKGNKTESILYDLISNWDLKYFDDMQNTDLYDNQHYGAFINDKLIGWVINWICGGGSWVTTCWANPDYNNTGVNQFMVNHFIKEAIVNPEIEFFTEGDSCRHRPTLRKFKMALNLKEIPHFEFDLGEPTLTPKNWERRSKLTLLASVVDYKSEENSINDHNLHCEKLKEHLLKELEQKNDLHLLDFGCGSGRFFELYNAIGNIDIVAIDKTIGFICRCRKQFPEILIEHIDIFDYPKLQFDTIVSVWVFEYMEPNELKIHLKKLDQTLKQRGTLFIITRGKAIMEQLFPKYIKEQTIENFGGRSDHYLLILRKK